MIILNAGFWHFKLPDDVKIDQLKCLMDAVHMERTDGIQHLSYDSDDISLEIRNEKWANASCESGVPELYKVHIFPRVIKKLATREHSGTIRFLEEHIEIINGGKIEQIDYKEAANPDTDPDLLVDELSEAVK